MSLGAVRSLISALCVALIVGCGSNDATVETAASDSSVAGCPPPSSLVARATRPSGEELLVQASVYDRALCLPVGVERFWGSTDIPVASFVGNLAITAGGQQVWVPLSSYVDLGNPSAVEIEGLSERGFTVVVHGQGDSGYVARLDVSGQNVTRRRLFNPAFEGEAGELSEYSYPEDW